MAALYHVIVGTGYSGRRLLERCVPGQCMGLSRRPATIGQTGVRALDLDSGRLAAPELPRNYSLLYTVPPRGDDRDERLARLLGVLDPLPQRIVLVSTTGVYGDHGGTAVDESFETRPGSRRSQMRVIAEQQLIDWAHEKGVSWVVLRVPGIYGPGRLGLDRLAAGEPSIREEDAYPGNRIHVDDLVSCYLAALDPTRPGGIYNVGDGDHRSSTWFAAETARQAGLPEPPQISRQEARQRFSPMRYSFVSESRRIETQRMRTELGITPRFADPVAGITASLAEERSVSQG
jgi:nucleoside-diphosphate-sugar epimerase